MGERVSRLGRTMCREFAAQASKPAQAVSEGLNRVNVACRVLARVSPEMREDDTQYMKHE